ncbi:chorismate-binding protein [Streptomyces sp. NPDC006700]|uniref:chorismate-binding protein n=1 Tax=unclassified Streptomyces TaxID=2593676 RepID=UPI0033C28ABF
MRTLLVDHDDSFTHNLFHRLSEMNGVEPQIVRFDDPSWRPGLLRGFDNVVLCPGPGTPHDRLGNAVSAEVCRQDRLPVLGVGLGHQAIALLHGGAVSRAPWPCHGRISPVRHTGAGLLRYLPNPLEVVRYHSFAVTGLSPALEPTAWATDDGVVMALRHRSLPLWGVQFHPESAGTDTGRQLLAAFGELTERHHASRRGPSLLTTGPSLLTAGPSPFTAGTRKAAAVGTGAGERPAAAAGTRRASAVTAGAGRTPLRLPGAGRSRPPRRRLRVLAEPLETRWEAETVFDHLFRSGDHPFWLDSSRADGGPGRVSVLGNADGPLAQVATANVVRGTVSVRKPGTAPEVVRDPFLRLLDEDLRSLTAEIPELPFDFALGWVGFLGYELKAECGGTRAHRSPAPDAVMVFADRAVVLDHGTDTTYLLALAEEGDEGPARSWLTAASARLAALPRTPVPPVPAARFPAPARPVRPRLRLRHERERYLRLVAACQEELASGQAHRLFLANMVEARTDLDPWEAYRALRRLAPAPFGAFLGFGALSVLSSAPERFLRVDRHGWTESTVTNGSRPRGSTPEEDALLIADLATSEPERAAHLTLVDLARHDLGSRAEAGAVTVDPLFDVVTCPEGHRLVSTVRARLRQDTTAVAALRSAFPGGSVTGAPKPGTMRALDRLESGPRGIHTGAIGYFSLSGAADFGLATRTAVFNGQRLRYGVGAAVTAPCDPDAVFEETAREAGPLLSLLGARFPGHGTPEPSGVGPHGSRPAASRAFPGATTEYGH